MKTNKMMAVVAGVVALVSILGISFSAFAGEPLPECQDRIESGSSCQIHLRPNMTYMYGFEISKEEGKAIETALVGCGSLYSEDVALFDKDQRELFDLTRETTLSDMSDIYSVKTSAAIPFTGECVLEFRAEKQAE